MHMDVLDLFLSLLWLQAIHIHSRPPTLLCPGMRQDTYIALCFYVQSNCDCWQQLQDDDFSSEGKSILFDLTKEIPLPAYRNCLYNMNV